MKFNKDDRVFHRGLKRYGIYVDDDWSSDDSCYVMTMKIIQMMYCVYQKTG